MLKRLERIHLLSRAETLKSLRHLLRELLEVYSYKEESIENIILGVNEACMNIIQHAYNNCSYGEIIIEIYLYDAGLQINILDFAEKSDLMQIKPRALDDIRPGGLGVHLIRRVMDDVEYSHQKNSSGNEIRMRKNFDMEEV